MRLLVLLCFIALVGAACTESQTAPAGPTSTPDLSTPTPGSIELRYAGGALRVELAITPEERARGLSNRTALPANRGMLFVYETPQQPFFWMKDTLLPLDMIWIRDDKRVLKIDANVQPEPGVPDAQLRHYDPGAPIRYVLELNAGTAARIRLSAGDSLAFDLPAR